MVQLRKLKRGRKGYYYLEHTLRDGNNFVNKRKYLGSILPKNIGEVEEEFMVELLTERYGDQLDAIKRRFSKEQGALPKMAREREWENLLVEFTYNTNRIEGSTLSLRETADLLQHGISPPNKPLKDVKETEAHRRVFLDMLKTKNKATFGKVLEWHHLLFRESAPDIVGRIRTHRVRVARSRTEFPLPFELQALLDEFYAWLLKNDKRIHPIILSALVHLRFVSTHPFSDGNGRISRILMNHVLHRQGYPFLIIEYTNRRAYYTALERSQLGKKPHIFVHYVIKRYLKAHGAKK